MLAIEWTAAAELDLREILSFISDRNVTAAEELCQRIPHDLEQAAGHPYLFRSSFRIAGLREIVVHPNYIVFYRVGIACIEVINVVHVRREFPTP